MDELNVSMDHWWNDSDGENRITQKPVILPFCPPKTSQELAWDRTRASMGDSVAVCIYKLQGGSNMTGTDLCVNKCKQSRSYLNHLVFHITVLYLFLEFKKMSVLDFQTFSFFKEIFTFV